MSANGDSLAGATPWQARQGAYLLVRVDHDPRESALVIERDPPARIAWGGRRDDPHSHEVLDQSVRLIVTKDGRLLVEVDGAATIVHPLYPPIVLPPGIYHVSLQVTR